MPSHDAQTGLCIVRVEVQADHLLITVTTKYNLGRNMYATTTDPERHFADPDAALAAVADFLRPFAQAIQE